MEEEDLLVVSTAVTGLERSRLAAALLRSPVERIVLLIWTVWDGIEGGFRRHQPKLTVQPWWWRFALGRFRCAKAPEAKARSRCQKKRGPEGIPGQQGPAPS